MVHGTMESPCNMWCSVVTSVEISVAYAAHNLTQESHFMKPPCTGNAWVHTQHCSYWCPDAKAPGHQYPQYWLDIDSIGAVSYRNITVIWNNIKRQDYILKKNPHFLRFNSNLHHMNHSTLCNNSLNNFGLVTPYGDRELGEHWLR